MASHLVKAPPAVFSAGGSEALGGFGRGSGPGA
jgi:hypothetical protein